MTIEEIKQELDRAFGKYTFEPKSHTYYCNGKKVGIGVTTFLHQFQNEFDKDTIAPKTAEKLGITIEELLKQWDYKRDFSCDKGTTCHEYNQSKWSKEKWKLIPFDNSKEYLEAVSKIKLQADNFYNDYKDRYIHIKDEQIVGLEDYDIASAIDHLFYDKEKQGLVLADYKTNTYLKGYFDDPDKKVYDKKMKIPLTHLKDNEFTKYKLQLSIYKYLLEEIADIKVVDTIIIYMTEKKDNYEIIDIPYLKDEVKKILEMRRVKGMKSIPVLLYGKSGTGKTASFRNYKKDELAYINVLDKPLPFKSDIKINSLSNYDAIIAGIKSTKRKTIFIDDAGFLLTNEVFDRATETGYTKFTQIAKKFNDLISEIKKIDGGKVVVISMHEENNDGDIKIKTAGKMIESNGVIEGNFTIALRSMCQNGNYIFRTRNNGQDITKTPIGMFETDEIENDFKLVDKAIREYYELDKEENKEERNEEK